MASQYVEIRITGNGAAFGKALRNIKAAPGAQYNPSRKTWTVRSGAAVLDRSDLAIRRVSNPAQRVAPSDGAGEYVDSAPLVTCPHYTVDLGCPLHGEFCASAA